MKRPRIRDVMRETGLSRATVDRVLNGRGGVHPRTRLAVEDTLRNLGAGPDRQPDAAAAVADLVLRVGRGFFDQLAGAVDRHGLAGLRVHDLHQAADAEMLEAVARLCRDVERPLILTAKDAEPLRAELIQARRRGKLVITFVSDLGYDCRDAFVGIDNRMAGQAAAFLIGGALQHRDARAGVVLGDYSYSCHEDREIGFRSNLRANFPNVQLADVARGQDSSPQTYRAVRELLEAHPDLDAIYNVAGGNSGLARALEESGRAGAILVVAHEANAVTVPLMHAGTVHYALAQDPGELLRTAVRLAMEGRRSLPGGWQLIDFAIHTKFNVPGYALQAQA